MDNIFEILVFALFILFNLFASWMQKKKKEQDQESDKPESVTKNKSETRAKKSIEEILFGTSQKVEVPPAPKSEHAYVNRYSDEKIKRAEQIINRQKEKSVQFFETANKIKNKNSVIKTKVKNIKNLREYIVINEILNKPKYFDY